MQDEVFELMARQHGSPLVARADISKFTGGAITPKWCANMDSAGIGIKGRFFIGRRCVYPVASVIEFLKEHSKASYHEGAK